MGEQSIAEKPFGKDSRGSGGEGPVAVAAVTLLQATDIPANLHPIMILGRLVAGVAE
jgi:hypothetical protein